MQVSLPHNPLWLHTAIHASIQAGKEIMKIYTDPAQDFGIEKKADNSPLTLADKAAHQCIVEQLSPLGLPILSEEGKHLPYEERREWDTFWLVDPLDGTKEFIKKNGEFTVNIALIHQQVPVMGIIYVPAKGTLYWGYEHNAYKASINSNDVFCVEDLLSSAEELSNKDLKKERDAFVIISSRSHMSPETEIYIAEMQKKHKKVELTSIGSSLKFCLVAEGIADAYPRYAPTMEWDTGAGDAIVRAMGCSVIDVLTGEPLLYNKKDLLNPWFLVEL